MSEERVRGFPAFPPRRRIGRRAQSWWGNAWVQAMEDTSLDSGQLKRGRRYAQAGLVGPITVSPGRIAAPVHDSQGVLFRTAVFIAEFTEAEWGRFLEQVAGQAGYIAALLDGDMPHELVEAAEDAGVTLLPGIGDLDPECDCPGWELPCKHAAALSYQASWLLDDDPFVLLLMRGRGKRELLDELQRRDVAVPPVDDRPAPEPEPAAAAFARTPAPLPELPPLEAKPAPALSVPPVPGLHPDGLRWLAAHAAVRARAMLHAEEPELDWWQDTVRIAATVPGLVDRLGQVSGRAADLPRAVRAWQSAGAAGLDVLESPWSPPAAELARLRTALAEAELPESQAWRNRCTVPEHDVQVRFGRDGRWHPYRRTDGDWWPAGPPDRDPAAVLAELLAG